MCIEALEYKLLRAGLFANQTCLDQPKQLQSKLVEKEFMYKPLWSSFELNV